MLFLRKWAIHPVGTALASNLTWTYKRFFIFKVLAEEHRLLSNMGKPIRKKRRKSSQIRYFEIGGLDIATGIITPSLLPEVKTPSRAQLSIQSWDILVSTVRPNRKNVGLVLPQETDTQLVASTGFSILRFDSPEEAVFYHAWLRSNEATFQLLRWNSGGTYAAIDHEEPGDILVPEFSTDLVKSFGRKWKLKFVGLDLSAKLTTAAKLLVEALIEGQISEADLITVQKALEAGDRTADREILSRLTRKGMDTPGEPPLFPDLESLYNILDALETPEDDP